MLLRLAPCYESTLQLRICISKVYRCPFFVFRPQDNTHHPLVGGWQNDMRRLPILSQPRRFTSLLDVFLFLAPDTTAQVPLDLTHAFCWTRATTWMDAQPFKTFLQFYECYVHDEPPYQLYFNRFKPKTGMPQKAKPESLKKRCAQAWAANTPLPIYSTPRSTRRLWAKFLTRHRIPTSPTDQATLAATTSS